MALHEQIRQRRQALGLSQEKLAEQLGVSRQAVAKWESGQSAPSTEKLIALARLFNLSLDEFADTGIHQDRTSAAEEALLLFRQEEQARQAALRQQRQENLSHALLIAGSYLLFYLAGRLLWCDRSQSTLLGWLFLVRPTGKGSYLYGWLLSSRMFWYAGGVSLLPALGGKRRFSSLTALGFWLGFGLGYFLGPYPAGAAYGHSHYGWAIWGCVWLLSILLGLWVERKQHHRQQ
ncbi:MAG: helix-turn-helix transcriptional regulator [Oscillospiraceae bacterium]|nr:helix-turn-helix transcriptional regulator [Oscillospiraceae bacterium]